MESERSLAERQFGRLLLPLARRWRGEADRAVAGLGLSHASGWALLHVGRLERDGEGVRQGALAGELDMRGSSLVPLLDRLEQAGLVLREAEAGDRRANRVRLTEAGRALVGRIEDALRTIRHELFAGIDGAEIAAAMRVLEAVDHRLLALRDGRS